jgi:hypothetical protein
MASMKRRGIELAVAVVIGCGGSSQAAKAPEPASGGPETCTFAKGGTTPDDATQLLPWPTRSIAELKGVTSGGYNTEGDVEDIFVPTPCPPGEMCAEQPPHVIVNEKSREEWVTNPRQLALVMHDPTKLKSGVRYRMSIAVCGTRQLGASVNEGEMRAFVEVVK